MEVDFNGMTGVSGGLSVVRHVRLLGNVVIRSFLQTSKQCEVWKYFLK